MSYGFIVRVPDAVCVTIPVASDLPGLHVFADAQAYEATYALATVVTTLPNALTTMATAEAVVTAALAAMQLRAKMAVASTRDASEAIFATVTRSQAAVLSRARPRS